MKASTCALSKVRPSGLGLLGSFFIPHSILSYISPPVLLDRTCTLLQVAISDSNLYLPVKLAYYNMRSRHEIVDAGLTAFDEEQLAGCFFTYDQSIMAKVALFPCRRKVHASYLRSVFHDDVKIELIRRRPVVSGCSQI